LQTRAQVGVLRASAGDVRLDGRLLRHVYEKRPFKRRGASEQAFTRLSQTNRGGRSPLHHPVGGYWNIQAVPASTNPTYSQVNMKTNTEFRRSRALRVKAPPSQHDYNHTSQIIVRATVVTIRLTAMPLFV
jgi:ribosomal protein S8E